MTDIDKLTIPLTATTGDSLQMSYDGSLAGDIADFEGRLAAKEITSDNSVAVKAIAEPLSAMNAEARELADFAANALSSDNEMTPSEIVSLTVKSQEFMFHSQLTANIANRTSDGIQQLFKQQG